MAEVIPAKRSRMVARPAKDYQEEFVIMGSYRKKFLETPLKTLKPKGIAGQHLKVKLNLRYKYNKSHKKPW